MAKTNKFVADLLYLLCPLGEVTARGMFGGWGICHGGKRAVMSCYTVPAAARRAAAKKKP